MSYDPISFPPQVDIPPVAAPASAPLSGLNPVPDGWLRAETLAHRHTALFGERLLKAFSHLNGAAPLELVTTTFRSIEQNQANRARTLPNFEQNGLVALTVANHAHTGNVTHYDISLVVDRPKILENCLSQIARQSAKLSQFEFLFDFSITPEAQNIHIHHVSIGKHPGHPLRGHGHISDSFAKAAEIWQELFTGWSVSTIVHNDAIAHLMRVQFNAKKLKLATSRLPNDIFVLSEDRRKVYQGTIS